MTTLAEKPTGFSLLSTIGTNGREVLLWLGVIVASTIAGIVAVDYFDLGWSTIEILGTTTGAVTVWLLAKNRPLGWWVSIVSVICFIYVFYTVALYGEVTIQVFYLVTGFQAIWLWVRGGEKKDGRPITSVPLKVVLITAPLFIAGWVGTFFALQALGGAAPFWDSLTTIMSITAHMWLVFRYAQSWWIWVAVDIIYIPLYLSRDLQLTSALYVVFLAMATMGAVEFWRALKTPEAFRQ